MSAKESSKLIRQLLRQDGPSSPRPRIAQAQRGMAQHAMSGAAHGQVGGLIDSGALGRLHRAVTNNLMEQASATQTIEPQWSSFETSDEGHSPSTQSATPKADSLAKNPPAPNPAAQPADRPENDAKASGSSHPIDIASIASAIAQPSGARVNPPAPEPSSVAPSDLERVRSASARRMVELPLRVRIEKEHDRGLGARFDPQVDELFDQVWVKVQRRLGQPDGDVDREPDFEEIRHHSIQSMLVTSWTSDEGSSTISLGLAARCAASTPGRVCLVDADFQSRGLTSASGRSSRPGLSELIAETASLEDVLVRSEDGGYYFIPAGARPDCDALANDIRLQSVIRLLEDRFRYIFYDTSCLKRGVEAMRWGRYVVNTILVVRAGTTRRQTITHAVDQLQLHGMRLLGTVLNRRVNHIPEWLYPHV